MKIRTGFVSNSSSSNFIIGRSYKTVFNLAKHMLRIRSSNSKNWIDTETCNINSAIINGRDPDSSICFTTCNYNTFIKKVEGYYVVTTCNNHPFIQELYDVTNCPVGVEKWLKNQGYLYDDDDNFDNNWFDEGINSWKFQCDEVFWRPEYDLELSRYDYMKETYGKKNENAKGYCSKNDHFEDIMVLVSTGKAICPSCYSITRDGEEPGIDNRFEILDL